jgi:signal transduction histidine kinase
VACNVRLPEPEPALSETAATELFRIFQECLTNVTRHAQATTVETELKAEPGWITLRVEDNGRGITGEQFADPRALGLAGMKERAVMLGGEIRFEHGPGRGTIVTVRIPFSGAEGREMA